MVIEYLEKLHQEMYEKKIKLERKYQKEEILLNDTIKFIKTLEDTLDENFESFTPWKIYHNNHTKIDILKDNKKDTENEMKLLKNEIEKYDKKIEEILEVIEYTRHNILLNNDVNNITSSDLLDNDENVSRETNNTKEYSDNQQIIDSMMKDYNIIYKKIINCTKFIEVDTVRTNIELQSLSKKIYDCIQKYNNQIKNMKKDN